MRYKITALPVNRHCHDLIRSNPIPVHSHTIISHLFCLCQFHHPDNHMWLLSKGKVSSSLTAPPHANQLDGGRTFQIVGGGELAGKLLGR